jgi:hypothetical protein
VNPRENGEKLSIFMELNGNPQYSLLTPCLEGNFCGFWAEFEDFESKFENPPVFFLDIRN